MAQWKLEDVQRLIKANNVWFSCHSRSIAKVREVFNLKGAPKTDSQAGEYILEKIQLLDSTNFSETIMNFGHPCDVYGENFDGIPWYIKFCLKDSENNECLNNLSFHPTEKKLKTNSKELDPWEKK